MIRSERRWGLHQGLEGLGTWAANKERQVGAKDEGWPRDKSLIPVPALPLTDWGTWLGRGVGGVRQISYSHLYGSLLYLSFKKISWKATWQSLQNFKTHIPLGPHSISRYLSYTYTHKVSQRYTEVLFIIIKDKKQYKQTMTHPHNGMLYNIKNNIKNNAIQHKIFLNDH